MLRAACEKSGGTVEVDRELAIDGNAEENERAVNALFGESMFHNPFTADNDQNYGRARMRGIWRRPARDVDKEPKERIKAAKREGLPNGDIPVLEEIIRKHRAVVRIRLAAEGPADIVPMKIRLDLSKRPMSVKVRKYPTKQRKLLDAYIYKLVQLG